MGRFHTLACAVVVLFLSIPVCVRAQVGEYRSEFGLGVNGGYVLSTVEFNPEIPQKSYGGFTGGLTVRYTCEKYFKSICALVAEVNFAQVGWREDILTSDDLPVMNSATGLPEEFERRLTYVQVPMFARLGWGRERKGLQFFFQAGPQVGFFLGDKIKSNFSHSQRNMADRIGAQKDATQDSLEIQHKFDYGIAAGLGLEYSHPKIGHIMLEGRYYYGLGDIFGNSKRDYFGRSNLGNIVIKLTYLIDVFGTNNSKIK